MQSRNNNNLKGIDVSNWKGNINFESVKNDGVEVVYIKATEGNYFKDKYAKQNYEGAKEQGLKVGFYHFFRANKGAKDQANFFIDYLNEIGAVNYDCKLALDIETTEGVGVRDLTSMCIEFLEEVKRLTGKEVVVYTYTSFANNNLDSRLSSYPVWIAHYGVNTPGANKIWSSWIGFQYSENGTVAGVNGGCDMNEFTEEIFIDSSNFNLDNATTKNVSTKLNIRAKGNVNSNIVGKIPAGERFRIKWVDSDYLGWYYIEYQGVTGYVSQDYVEKLQMATTCNVDSVLNVRAEGNTSSNIVATINPGEVFRIDWVDSDFIGWYRVTTKNGKVGFVNAEFVKKL
ncbi:GH25 family lysozyme [Clostridium perfringens]|uniref:GH25 family lysozyme n=1 Tax=Clostridium perfringens TaxID=1502 RepID=UPI000D7159AA|nr:GH25 family lysozyme [Clostridium perfringens]PWX24614.1 autolytic lysozyme [Clostridium perfringens]